MGLTEKLDRVLYQDIHPLRIAANYLDSFRTSPERLIVDIKHRHFVKLAQWREQALARGQITSDLKTRVPAKIRYGDQTFDVSLRLKGELTDHVRSRKWSFRVNVKSGNLFGMRRFSLQHPRTRHYIWEWLYLEALAREDIPRQRYRFVEVTLNGRDLGVYAMEEVPAKQPVEHHKRREGVVVRLHDEYHYRPFADLPGRPRSFALVGGLTNQHSAEVVAFGADEIAENPGLQQQFLVAHNLLQSFRIGRLSTSQVFNVEKLAMYFAISELTGCVTSSSDWRDIIFLYEPVSSRLEPIGKEGVSLFLPIGRRVGPEAGLNYVSGAEFTNEKKGATNDLHALMFSDTEFFRHYVKALETVASQEYVDTLVAELEPGIESRERILHREWPFWYFNRKRLDENAAAIRAILAPENAIHAYLAELTEDTVALDLAVIQPMPVEILGLVVEGSQFGSDAPTVLPGRARDGHPNYRRLTFRASESLSWSDELRDSLQIRYRLLGTGQTRQTRVFPVRYIDQDLLVQDLLRLEPNLHLFPFLEVDEGNRVIELHRGDWRLAESLVLPAGYQVVVGEGVRLDLVQGAMIVSLAALSFRGSEEDPVVVRSTDGTGKGIAVLKARERSTLEHTLFDSLSGPAQNGRALRGAVTFYESPVEIRRCEFRANRSEDSLNLVRSDFSVEESAFSVVASDAVGTDFSKGKIARSSFHDLQGDAIDVSGSTVELDGVHVWNGAATGVTAGDGTYLNGHDIEISGVRVGIAVKDLSIASLTDVSVREAEIGLASFGTRPELGSGRMRAERVSFERVAREYVVADGAAMIVGGRNIPESQTEERLLLQVD
jgi:hypothetical protein